MPTFARRHPLLAVAAVAALPVAAVGWSLGAVLLRSSTDPVGVRLTEWARDHDLGAVVDATEHWWYGHHQPPLGGVPEHGIPRVSTPPVVGAAAPPAVPPPDRPAASVPPLVTSASVLPGEGVWQATGRAVDGAPAVWSAYLRPDPVHTSVVVGVAWMDGRRLAFTLHNGSQLPGGGPWQHGDAVAAADAPRAVAAFNSGFRLDSSRGGYDAEGHVVRPLVAGRASLVLYADGHADVGEWGRDDSMGATVAAVRQNLDLIVDHGAAVAGLDDNANRRWGGTLGNKIYTWRSGVGVDAHGNVIYAGGPGMSVATLADVLARAGAARAMELDINPAWVLLTSFTPGDGPGAVHGLVPQKLLPGMQRPADHFLRPATRDFVEVDAPR